MAQAGRHQADGQGGDDHEQHGQHDVGQGPGHGDQGGRDLHLEAPGEPGRVENHRLGPADEEAAEEEAQEGEQHGADGIDVGQRVERHAAHARGGVVVQQVGGGGVGGLVHAQGEEQRHEGDEDGRNGRMEQGWLQLEPLS